MKILVIDFNALFYRSYHSLIKQDMRNSQGQGTWAVFGFLKTLIDQARSTKADLIMACDDGGNGFRREWYDGYKASRKPMDHEMLNQKMFLVNGLEEIGVPVVKVAGYEADDLIYSITKNTLLFKGVNTPGEYIQNENLKAEIRVVTVDQDLLKLVSANCEVIIWKSNSTVTLFKTVEDVVKGFGCPPNQITDYKSLIGDTSDNIPGISGFGPKKADEFFKNYTSIQEGLDDEFKKLPEKLALKINENYDKVKLSYSLASLYDIPNTAMTFVELDKIVHPSIFLDVLEFKSLENSLLNPTWKITTSKFGYLN